MQKKHAYQNHQLISERFVLTLSRFFKDVERQHSINLSQILAKKRNKLLLSGLFFIQRAKTCIMCAFVSVCDGGGTGGMTQREQPNK